MLRFTLRRLVIIPPALLLVNLLGYTYAYVVLPLRAARTPYLFIGARPGPFLPGYLGYLEGLIRLDLGTVTSGGTGRSLAAEIGRAIPASIGLLSIALALSVLIGLALGLGAVRPVPPRRRGWLNALSTVGLALPSFYIGSLLILAILAYVLARPGRGLPLPVQGFGWDLHLVLPTLALMLRPTVQIAQVASGLLVDELGERYVVTARSIGHRWSVIMRRHVMRNVLAAVVLTVAGSSRLLVGELILVEWLFNWPGLGTLFAQTLIPPSVSTAMASSVVHMRFLNPVVIATVLTVFAALFLLTDLAASMAVRAIDPRLRKEEVTGG